MPYTPKAQATRQRIIDSASALIFSKGLARTKLDEVLRAAKVQKGNFYYYFESKDDLGLVVLRECARGQVENWLKSLIRPDADPLQNIERVISDLTANQLSDSINGHGALVRLWHEVSDASDAFRAELTSLYDIIITAFAHELNRLRTAGRLAAEGSAHELATFLFCTLQGAFLLYRSSKRADDLHTAVKQALARIKG